MSTKGLAVLVLMTLVAWSAVAEAPVALRRFAFIAGSNDGGDGLERLRYAESDARSFATVLQDLGGVRQQDLVLVTNPSLQRFRDALQKVRQMVGSPREMDERRELVFYYSGHSDDDGLLLGKERVSWNDIRGDLAAISADVKVAIVDSCSSGSLTRAKGGVARPAFLFDASSDMTGHAYLTSASAEEAAQESDRIGSSFFTHYLISGLRGAADAGGDGVVTLDEAYAYAYKETLASTEKTQYGPQHPAREMDIAGSGNIVLTDLRSAAAGVTVSEDLAGRLYFRDSEGNLAVELAKTYGDKVELGLEPDTYSVVLDTTKGSRLGGQIRVTTRQKVVLTGAMLKPVTLDQTAARGDIASDGAQPAQPALSDTKQAAAPPGPGEVIGAAVGAAVSSALGKVMGDAVGSAVNAAITAASSAPKNASVPPKDVAPEPAAVEPGHTEPGHTGDSGPHASVFHFSFLTDFRGGFFTSQDDHIISLNLLVGSTGSSHGFELGGLANLESGDVVGFQAAGLANVALGRLGGFQAAGLVNYVGGDALFFQAAGLANISGSMAGVQTAGLANVALGDFKGAQVSGLINWTDAETTGTQISGLANWSSRVVGPQISVVNVSDTVVGAQIGVVNIAREVTGTQIGVFNFSQHIDGVPLGLMSLELDGRHDIAVWLDMDGTTYGSVSFGAKRLYTVVSAGWMPGSGTNAWSLGLGLGGRSDAGPFYFDYDLSLVSAMDGANGWGPDPVGSLYPRIRAVAGLPIFGGISIEAGAVLRILIPYLSASIAGYDSSKAVFQPGFIVGLAL